MGDLAWTFELSGHGLYLSLRLRYTTPASREPLVTALTRGWEGRLQFAVPELRVGTLDALLALSDDLVKTCSAAEQATGKVARQIAELTDTHDAIQFLRLDVDGVPVERYLTQFQVCASA